MTITLTKTKLALSILVAALLVPATAFASHVFSDVPDDKFYADPVEWAFDNEITTGKSPTSFAPDDNVTRGESVTFLKRYNDNIVEPATTANAAAAAAAQADADAAQADADALEASMPTEYWAWVTSGGNLFTDTSSEGVTATRTATGNYVVTFPTDVNRCSWSVAHRSVDGLIVLFDPDYTNQAFFDLSTRSTGFFPNPVTYFNTDIRVAVSNPDADAKNTDFNLHVTCFPS